MQVSNSFTLNYFFFQSWLQPRIGNQGTYCKTVSSKTGLASLLQWMTSKCSKSHFYVWNVLIYFWVKFYFLPRLIDIQALFNIKKEHFVSCFFHTFLNRISTITVHWVFLFLYVGASKLQWKLFNVITVIVISLLLSSEMNSYMSPGEGGLNANPPPKKGTFRPGDIIFCCLFWSILGKKMQKIDAFFSKHWHFWSRFWVPLWF